MEPTEDFTLTAYATAVTAKNVENRNYTITDVIVKQGMAGHKKLVIVTDDGEIYPNQTSKKNITSKMGSTAKNWVGGVIYPAGVVEYPAGNSVTWEVIEL